MFMGLERGKNLLPGAVSTIWEDPRDTVPSKKTRRAAVKCEQYRVADNFLSVYTCIHDGFLATRWINLYVGEMPNYG